MMEPVEFKDFKEVSDKDKEWATNGTQLKRKPRIINSLYLDADELYQHNIKLAAKYEEIEKNEVKYETYRFDDAEFVIVAYGSTSRICKSVIDKARADGIKAGMIRPITIFPFPYEVIAKAAEHAKMFLSVEMSMGQMVEDVKLAVNGKVPVKFFRNCRRSCSYGGINTCQSQRTSRGKVEHENSFEVPKSLAPFQHTTVQDTHGIIHRLVAEAIDELGIQGETIGVSPVGCAVLAYNYFDLDIAGSCTWKGTGCCYRKKRAHPDRIVFTYQGDGDLASIGAAEIVHAAMRSENT